MSSPNEAALFEMKLLKAEDENVPGQPLTYYDSDDRESDDDFATKSRYVRCTQCYDPTGGHTYNRGMCGSCMHEFKGSAISGFKYPESGARIAARREVNLAAWKELRRDEVQSVPQSPS